MISNKWPYWTEKLSTNIYCIRENDYCRHNPLMYLLIGTEKALLFDTGCGTGNLYTYLEFHFKLVKQKKRLLVVNSHNHPEQTGNNWQFSPLSNCGLIVNVEALCASNCNPYYTELHDNDYDWQVRPYKVTKWLTDGEIIQLGKSESDRLEVFHTPGHTPDSLSLWYSAARRLFIGGLFHQYSDILLTIKQQMISVKRVLSMVEMLNSDRFQIRYSSAVGDIDGAFLPNIRKFQRFLISILAGTYPIATTVAGPIYQNAICYSSRGNEMRIFLSKRIVGEIDDAKKRKKSTYEIID